MKLVRVWRSSNRKGNTIKMNLMLNMTLDHRSPLNHAPIQEENITDNGTHRNLILGNLKRPDKKCKLLRLNIPL